MINEQKTKIKQIWNAPNKFWIHKMNYEMCRKKQELRLNRPRLKKLLKPYETNILNAHDITTRQ